MEGEKVGWVGDSINEKVGFGGSSMEEGGAGSVKWGMLEVMNSNWGWGLTEVKVGVVLKVGEWAGLWFGPRDGCGYGVVWVCYLALWYI